MGNEWDAGIGRSGRFKSLALHAVFERTVNVCVLYLVSPDSDFSAPLGVGYPPP